jgi:maleylpyruvate isomerase
MTSASHLYDNLGLLAAETNSLIRTAQGLDEDSIRAASLCPGWTRAHVLAHLARNADALGNLVRWAVTGTPVAMYRSPQAREDDIDAGSTRTAQEIVTDLQEAAARFASAAPGLAGPPEQVEVEMRGRRKVLAGQLPTLRLLEVVIHHVDLNAGYSFADADPGFVKRAISNAVARIAARDDGASILLTSSERDSWSMGEGTQEVTGSNATLLLWLARGDERGVSSKQALPVLPAWG